ncbi:hypothetical protein BT69DRAFT_711462 [Atractiella rhizophila]|nr:hypothetical protein BT69DRAFT_711462 [Atractiella rhizophila]
MKSAVAFLLFAFFSFVFAAAADVDVHKSPKHFKRVTKKKPHIYTADATVFDAGLGACGEVNTASDFIVALGGGHFDKGQPAGDTNPNHNHYCGKQVKVTANGVTIKATIKDKCPTCAPNDLDFALAPFQKLFNGATTGRFKVKWNFA